MVRAVRAGRRANLQDITVSRSVSRCHVCLLDVLLVSVKVCFRDGLIFMYSE